MGGAICGLDDEGPHDAVDVSGPERALWPVPLQNRPSPNCFGASGYKWNAGPLHLGRRVFLAEPGVDQRWAGALRQITSPKVRARPPNSLAIDH